MLFEVPIANLFFNEWNKFDIYVSLIFWYYDNLINLLVLKMQIWFNYLFKVSNLHFINLSSYNAYLNSTCKRKKNSMYSTYLNVHLNYIKFFVDKT